MWFLLGTTLTASFFDSLNPSAIAQQMLLQAMVKKKRHICFFQWSAVTRPAAPCAPVRPDRSQAPSEPSGSATYHCRE